MVFHLGGAQINLVVLVILGFCVGVLGGFFGVGGGFIITPALNALGAPMGLAIGTGLAQILGTSVIATLKHRKLGNVDVKLGIILVISMVPAVEIGKRLVILLTNLGMAGDAVRYVYIVLLVGFGSHMLRSCLSKHSQQPLKTSQHERPRFRLPPMISLQRSARGDTSLWVPVGLGVGTGILSGLVGVGGGFVMVPMLDTMGIPAATVVGTSLFAVLLGSGTYGTFTYGMSNEVSAGAALVMLLGASIGAQIGARAMVHAAVRRFRFLFAVLLLLVAISVVLKQGSVLRGLASLDTCSTCLLLGATIGMSLFIAAFPIIRTRGSTGMTRRVRETISNLKRIARRGTAASLMNADAMLGSDDWPYLWRK